MKPHTPRITWAIRCHKCHTVFISSTCHAFDLFPASLLILQCTSQLLAMLLICPPCLLAVYLCNRCAVKKTAIDIHIHVFPGPGREAGRYSYKRSRLAFEPSGPVQSALRHPPPRVPFFLPQLSPSLLILRLCSRLFSSSTSESSCHNLYCK